jgi:hypothetical protein
VSLVIERVKKLTAGQISYFLGAFSTCWAPFLLVGHLLLELGAIFFKCGHYLLNLGALISILGTYTSIWKHIQGKYNINPFVNLVTCFRGDVHLVWASIPMFGVEFVELSITITHKLL